MTYDVQRWDSPDYDVELEPLDDGLYVLAADAEAHEKAAVEEATQAIIASFTTVPSPPHDQHVYADNLCAFCIGRQQAIRDCIAVVEGFGQLSVWESWIATDGRCSGGYIAVDAVETLRALLEGEGY